MTPHTHYKALTTPLGNVGRTAGSETWLQAPMNELCVKVLHFMFWDALQTTEQVGQRAAWHITATKSRRHRTRG